VTFASGSQVQAGDILAGKYLVERVLGAGGMGMVVSARHLQLDELVAIKFLLPELLDNEEAVVRFAREARAAAKIKGDNVARVTDVGTLANGAPYMVMEYLEGTDLAQRLKQRGPLPVDEVIDFVTQACEAIAQAHAIGIIHRDLKPSNLFVIRGPGGTDRIKVLDFGISKVTGPVGSAPDIAMTRTAAVMGSPVYMSPEQMESTRSVDPGTDIWALGVILYELLTGKIPFEGTTLPEVCVRIATRAPPPISTHRPDLPRGLEAAILRCLEKQRENRYRNVAELTSALAEFGPRRARESADRVAKIIEPSALSEPALESTRLSKRGEDSTAGGTMANWGQTAPHVARGRAKIVAAASVAGLLVAGALAFLLLRRDAAPAAATTAPDVPSAPVAAELAPAAPSPTRVEPPSTEPPSKIETAAPPAASITAPLVAASALRPSPAFAPPQKPKPPPPQAAKPAAAAVTTGAAATPPASSPDIFERGRKW